MKKKLFVYLSVFVCLCISALFVFLPFNKEFETDAVARGFSEKYDCLMGYGNCAVAIFDEPYTHSENEVQVHLRLSDQKLSIINVTDKKNEDGDSIVFKEDFFLPSSLAKKLGATSIKIKRGVYQTVFSENKFGTTVVNVEVVQE